MAEGDVNVAHGRAEPRLVQRTRVKVCGITRPADGVAAASLGADAIGLVFYSKSPRAVDLAQAGAIVRALPPFVTVVGLFVNAEPKEIRGVLNCLPIDLLQFHGDEAAAECEAFGRPYIRAVPMREGVDLAAYARRFGTARALLLDTYQADKRGGTGTRFDWSWVSHSSDIPIVLAGGLTPGNVGQAVTEVRPFAVDVSGGVESGPGLKDPIKMAEFIEEVNRVGIRRGQA